MSKFYFFLVSCYWIFDLVSPIPTSNSTNVTKVSSPTTTGNPVITKTIENANDSINEIDDIPDEGWEYENTTVVDTRRILYSKRVPIGKRPYMIYLQLTKESAKAHKYKGWLCGGVILSNYYVLTSAACVEDAEHFYIVSGTTKFVDSFDYKSDNCVCKHRRKVVWKCIPKNYKFDFQDSIKWSSNDIAIVKVNKPFKFGVVETGCEFATDLVCYNNVSRELEKAGTKGYIAGWGSGNTFREGVYRRQSVHIPENAKYLQEAKVCVMDNEQCAKKWAQKFRTIINQYMVCTKDVMKRISAVCDKKYANCTDMENRRNVDVDEVANSDNLAVDLGRHLRDPDDYTARRTSLGGFCENDHGGPFIVKYKGKERVIGVISACKIDPKSHSCHGPFLYTSVFKNRQFISCAITKDIEENCRRVFRSGITHEEWSVNWDNVDEDDNRDESGEDESEESDEPSSLRENKPKVVNRKDKKLSSDESSDSDDSKESRQQKNIRERSKKDEKATEQKKENTKNKHASKRPKKTKEERRKSRHIKPSDRQNKDDTFYESSRDDNVNDPEDL